MAIAPVELVSTFTTQGTPGGYLPQGDPLAPGADPRWRNGDSRLRYVFNGSTPGLPNVDMAGRSWPGAFIAAPSRFITGQTPRLLGVPRSWGVEWWTSKPAGQVRYGYEGRHHFPDLGLPSTQSKWAMSFRGFWGPNFQIIKDMKTPGLNGGDLTVGLGDYYNLGFNDIRINQYDQAGGGVMTTSVTGNPNQFRLTAYLAVGDHGGVEKRGQFANLAQPVRTEPGGTSNYLLSRGVYYEIAIEYVRNTHGQRNGSWHLYVQPAGQPRVLRHVYTNLGWFLRPQSNWNTWLFRNFWGGKIPEEAPSAATDANSGPRFSDFAFADTLAAIPLPRGA